MPPSPPGNGKRKAGEEPGSVQKRPRKDGPVSNKRKLREGEVKSQSHGLVFRRDVSSQPSSQTAPAPRSDANVDASLLPSPSKKLRTGPSPSPVPTTARAGSSTKGKGKAQDLAAVLEEREREEVDDDGEGAGENGHRSTRRASTYSGMVTDLSMPLEPRETPRIEANRSFRGEPVAGPSTPKRQRRSSQSKGKRASMNADNGIVTTPHRSVESQHFYHHIDAEMSEAARMSLLLQWSYKRQLVSATPSGKDPPETALLRECVDTLVRELAEKKVDVSGGGGGAQYDRWRGKTFDANVQNQKNRLRHANFTEDIRRTQAEDSAWVKAVKFYNELRARHDEDEKAMQQKGKRRSEADTLPDINLAPPDMRAGIQNVLDVISLRHELPAPDPRLARVKFDAEGHLRNMQAALRVSAAVDDGLHSRFAELWHAMSEPRHLPPHLPPAEVSHAFANPSWARGDDELIEQLRALSVLDQQRPPERVDDDARQAARLAARAAQAGPSARPITQAPPPTPRRPNTPGRR